MRSPSVNSIRTKSRGFTLIEAIIVVGIIGVLAAAAGAGVIYGMGKIKASNAMFDVAAVFSIAQMRATSKNHPHYVIFWEKPVGTTFERGLRIVMRRKSEPAAPAVDWNTVDVTDMAPLGSTILMGGVPAASLVRDIDLSVSAKVYLYPISNFTTAMTGKLPAPFNGFNFLAAGGAATAGVYDTNLMKACTFCVASTAIARGVIEYGTDGWARMITGGNMNGGAVALASIGFGEKPSAKVIAVATPAGNIKTF
jgi:prepilin-type N-terminal cleavage/methylation domain-containing protein